MLIWTKGNGYTYKDEETGREYALLEMKTLGANLTSDTIMIWDDETNAPINWVQGATIFTKPDELDALITEYVAGYKEKRKRENVGTVRYEFNPVAVKRWKDDVVDDILERGICGDFSLTHGGRTIKIPDTAYAYEMLTYALDEIIADESDMWEGIV